MFLPGITDVPTGRLLVGLDSSGSISGEFFTQFFAEIEEIARLGVDVIAIACDTRVHDRWDISAHEVPVIRKTKGGGGGTSFVPVFEYAKKCDEELDGIIYLTDLEGEFPSKGPGIPTLWVVFGSCTTKPPFGNIARVDGDN